MKIIPSNYGSIPHLSTSKLTQQADKKIELGQELLLTKKTRDWRDLVIVTEKLDGSNVGIICTGDGVLVPITRSGYDAYSSQYAQYQLFCDWLRNNYELFQWLPENWRVCGEWMAQAHGTLYNINGESPFVAFDIIDEKNKRIPYIAFIKYCYKYGIQIVPVLHIGQPISIDTAIKLLGKGYYGKAEKPEGVVYRLEREYKLDFLAKWVRGDKEDGKYMKEEIFNEGFKI